MHRGDLAWILLIIVLGAFVGGCASRYGTDQPAETLGTTPGVSLAVLPFHSVSEARGSGMIVSDILTNQLYALGNSAVIPPEVVVARLADRESEAISPSEAGSLVGAPYILTGRVTEYTYKTGVGETPVVGVTARLIYASSGTVVWSATRTATGGGNWFQEDSLSRLTVMLCKDLADSLNSFLENHPLPPHAASVAPQYPNFDKSTRPG